MPHLTIEYSANLERRLNIPEMIETLHKVAGDVEAFPLAGLRTRAARRENYRIADGHPDNAFIHVVLRIAHGRDLGVRQAAGETLFAALQSYLEPIAALGPLAISMAMEEFDPVLSYKGGNIREHMAKRAS